jgi:hypothetical protein
VRILDRRRRHPKAALGLAVAALLVLSVVIGLRGEAAAAATSPAKIPARLRVLERRMLSLPVNSERVARRMALRGAHLGSSGSGSSRGRHEAKRSKPRVTTHWLPASVYEVSRSPRLGLLRTGAPGHRHVEAVQVGDQQFMRSAAIGLKDSGRPWISLPLHKGVGGLASLLGDGPASLAGKIANAIKHAESVKDLGAATVLGHRTTGFAIRYSMRDVERVLIISSGGRSHAKTTHAKTIVKRRQVVLNVFFEHDGLPVLIRETSTFGAGITFKVRTETVATEIPVAASAPPASQTISLAELEKQAGHGAKEGSAGASGGGSAKSKQ